MGYETYYKTLLQNLGCLQKDDECHLSTGLTRISEAKLSNRKYKQVIENKRRRKHGQLAKSKQQIYEERVDRAKNMGTYQTGVALIGNESTQQSSKQPKNNSKVCKSCGGTGHKTSRSKTCNNHHQYLATKSIEKAKQQQICTHLDVTGNKDAMVRSKIDKKETMGIGDGEVLGEGGVILAGVEGAPLPAVIDVSSSSKK